MDNKKKSYLWKAGCVLLIVILLCIVILIVRSHNETEKIEANVSKLETLEKQPVEKTEERIEKIEAKEKEQEKKKSLTDTDFRKRFAGCVIAGDSITEGLYEFGYLDKDIAVYKRGVSIESKSNIMERTVSLKPKVVFLSFGLNDLELYNGDSDSFVKAYKRFISELNKKLPDVKIYINSVLPATPQKASRVSALKYSDKFNAALKVMCKELGITFIDNTSIARAHPEYYEPDGQHFKMQFYALWLSNMAKKAGL